MNLTALLASFPSPDRGVWHLGPVPIRAYALCIIVGIIVAIWWGERRFVARGGAPGTIVDIAVWAVPFGLVGGRVYHVLTDWSKYFGANGNATDAFKIWQGGLGIWGAIALGALGAWIGARRKGVPLTAVADAAAPGIVVAQAIGRIGNWFNQELFGKDTSLPWGLEIYRRVNPDNPLQEDTLRGIADGGPATRIVHPTFLYELLWCLGVAALVVWADRRFRLGRGRAFALYVAGYTVGRFWIELLRVDEATMVSGVRINVITSVVLFLAAAAYLLLVRGPREVLATEPAPDAVDATAAGAAAEGAAPAAHAEAASTDAGAAGNEARDAHAPEDETRDAHVSVGPADPAEPAEPGTIAGPEVAAETDHPAKPADAGVPGSAPKPGSTAAKGTSEPAGTAVPTGTAEPGDTADVRGTAETADVATAGTLDAETRGKPQPAAGAGERPTS